MSEKYWDKKVRELNSVITGNYFDDLLDSTKAVNILKQIALDQRSACAAKAERVPRWMNSETIKNGDDFVCRYDAIRTAILNAEIE